MPRVSIQSAIVVIGLIGALWAQDDADTDAAPSFQHERWQDYRVGAGDTLEIQVVDVPQLSQTVDVTVTGEIGLFPMGSVEVEGLSAADVESKIAQILEEKQLVQKAQVLVFVRDYRAKRVYVSGELAFPGEFVMSNNLTVLDSILLAGGVTPLADEFGYVLRRTQGTVHGPPTPDMVENPSVSREGVESFRIDLRPLAEGKLPQPDLILNAGDYVVVPRRTLELYFVMGEVHHPLNYVLPRGKALWVSQAIASAGGPTTTAKMSEGILVRNGPDGSRQEILVDFKAILDGRQEDIEVQPNDMIFIPGSIIKTIGEGYVRAANAMIAGTAFRVGRSYQLPDRQPTVE